MLPTQNQETEEIEGTEGTEALKISMKRLREDEDEVDS
jgi:hypothetical protein